MQRLKRTFEYYYFTEVKRYLLENGWTKEEIKILSNHLMEDEDLYITFFTDLDPDYSADLIQIIKKWNSMGLPKDPTFYIYWK